MGGAQSRPRNFIGGRHFWDQKQPVDENAPVGVAASEVFERWPALEVQLETSFRSLDLDSSGLLSYDTLEPVLRHHIMQMGLLEYASRFTHPTSGELQVSAVADRLPGYGISLSEPLDLVDWKNLVACWVHRIWDAQEEDVQRWQASVREMQEEQARKYREAMTRFQQDYVNQLDDFHRMVEAANSREDEARRQWEDSVELQEEFRQTQLKYVNEKTAEAQKLFNSQISTEEDVIRHLLSSLQIGRSEDGHLATLRYAYPATITASGAPVSGGSALPRRRQFRRQPQSVRA